MEFVFLGQQMSSVVFLSWRGRSDTDHPEALFNEVAGQGLEL